MKNNKIRILILDGDHKNALAIIRHLGKTKDYIIDVISYSKASVGFYSKYTNNRIITESPKKNSTAFISKIVETIKKNNYTAIIPVSYISFQLCSKNRSSIEKYTSITIASPEVIKIASSKVETYKLSEKLGIPYPKVFNINDINDINNLEINYPCVVKAPFEAGKNIVEYAKNKTDLIKKFNKIVDENDFNGVFPIVQHFIVGEGVGFFAYYIEGKCVNYFVHKRIREYPITGGASTVAESFFNQDVINNGKKILDYLQWEGVAMVEFKKDNSTGEYNLMEINAKFWGSLDLALAAGINFPQMIIDTAKGNIINKSEYEKIRFQWILNGDLFHLLENPKIFFSFLKDLFISNSDFYFSDLLPNLFQILNIPIHYYKKWFK